MPGVDLISLVQYLGYPGIATIVFLESGVFFGFFLPGASLLFVAGMLASLGIFDIWILLPLIIVSAILGDTVGYWFGSYVGKALYKRPNSRFFKQEYVELAHDFFEKYGKAAVLLGRFVPVVRTFVPILAGVGGMNYRIFLFYNVIGAIIWAGGATFLGFFIGSQIPDAEHYLSLIVAIVIGVTTLPLVLAWWKHWKQEVVASETPRAVVFDLDNTLARATERLTPKVAEDLAALLERVSVAIMSGASFDRIQRDVLAALPSDTKLENLYLFPDTGARCYRYKKGSWKEVYKHAFDADESDRVASILEEGLRMTGIIEGAPQYGERILKRDTQVTLAALGLDAPADLKSAWDPDRSKRKKLKAFLDPKLPGYDIKISSRTAIDITKVGVDKAVAVRWLGMQLRASIKHMLFVGDDLGEGGNDAIVIPTGIQTRQTSGPEETVKIIEEILALMKT